MRTVAFHHQFPSGLRQATPLKSFILSRILQSHLYKGININIIFLSDDELLTMNRTHLHHDYYTDIITFNLSDTRDSLFAELYISVERVKDNAHHLGFPYQSELLRVIFHGILHLLGYSDKTEIETRQMRTKENEWLNEFTEMIRLQQP